MAAANTYTELDGLFRDRFGDKLENAIPDLTFFQQMVPFKEDKALGDEYKQPVILGREHGITRIKRGDGLVTLRAPVAGQIKEARTFGYEYVLRGQIDYSSIFSAENKAKAFDDSVGVMVGNLLDSGRHYLEIDLMWGQSLDGIGKLDSTQVQNSTTLKIDVAHWGPGIWNGMEGASIQIWTPGATLTFKSQATIVSIDPDAAVPTITVAYTTAAACDAGDVIYVENARNLPGVAPVNGAANDRTLWKILTGLDAIVMNGNGSNNPVSLYEINASTHQVWRAVNYDALGVDLSFDTLLKVFSRVTVKGGNGEYIVFVSPLTFANLMSDQGALRRYDKADSPAKYVVGAKDITFYTQAGSMMIIGHPLEKQGFAHGFPKRHFKRVGATDLTFDTQKMPKIDQRVSQFFLPIPDKNGVEIRCYSNQQLFTERPGHCFRVHNIVNSV